MKAQRIFITALLIVGMALFIAASGVAEEHHHDAPAAAGHAGHGDAHAGEHEGQGHEEHGDHEEEEDEEYLPIVHGVYNMLVFLFLGVPMALSGFHRLMTTTGIWAGAPLGFHWAKHAMKGKIFIIAVLFGLGGGLFILYLDGFDPGHALPHLAAGVTMTVLFLFGGLTGLRLEKGKAPDGVKYAHAACNLAGILIFLFQIASGLAMLLEHS